MQAAGGNKELPVRDVTSNPPTFVRIEQFRKLVEDSQLEQSHKPLERWRVYSRELRRDPSLLAYYDFEPRKGNPSLLPNVAENAKDRSDGAITNATWSDGRMPGKHALLFNGPRDHVRVNVPQKTDDLTLAAWVCFHSLDGGQSSALFMNEQGQFHQVHWQLDNNERRLVFFTSFTAKAYMADESTANPKSWAIMTDSNLHRWMHLVVVFDHRDKHVRFYVNGRRLNEIDYGTSSPIAIGYARIGNWDQEARNLLGKIDELAIFGRPLTDEEVKRMHAEALTGKNSSK